MRDIAQLIRRVDDGDKDAFADLAKLYGYSGRAYIIGFTGSPGVGKSTLVDRIESPGFVRMAKPWGSLPSILPVLFLGGHSRRSHQNATSFSG